MHIQTYSSGDVGRMLAHYDRSIGPRDHIDPSLPVVDMMPEGSGSGMERYRRITEGLEIGPKTRPLADIVVTKPKGYDGDALELFRAAYTELAGKVGEGNVVSAHVHLDEPGAQPHMHFAFVPVAETPVMTNDKTRPLLWTRADEAKNPAHRAGTQKTDGKGTPRWRRVPKLDADGRPVMRRTASASKMFSKQAMRELHPQMEKALCAALGVDRVGITLDADDDRRKLSGLDHREYERLTEEVGRQRQEVERLDRAIAKTKRQGRELVARNRELAQDNAAMGDRLSAKRDEMKGLERRNAELNEAIADKQGDLIELDSAVSDKEFELQDARERLECLQQAGERASERIEQLESIVADVRRFDHAGRAEKGSILDSIVGRCDALVTRIRSRIAELAERVRTAFSRDDWGIDLDDEGREAKDVASDERSPMRLAEAAKQAAAASAGMYGSRNAYKPDRGAR